jgi:homoserine O-acetyltransferase
MALIVASSARQLQLDAPTLEGTDRLLDGYVAKRLAENDANDFLYAWEASRSYDPGPGLDRIRAPVFAINFADDEINPPELGVMERELARVPRGRYILVPASDATRGHLSFYNTSLWKQHLLELLAASEGR